MSTQIIHQPKGEKDEILQEWARIHTQQLLDRQSKVLQVRNPATNTAPINIRNLRDKKAANVLQEERHWLCVTIPQAHINDVITYIGCISCGKRANIPVRTKFHCINC